MKLRSIVESTDLALILSGILGDSGPVSKLIRWSFSRNDFTDPGELHTGSIIRHELLNNKRLVGNPWKSDCVSADFDDLDVVDYGKQWMVALPKNRDILDLVVDTTDAEAHLIRGLAFGYEPESVFKYYKGMDIRKAWYKHLIGLGIKLSQDYETGGYASVAKGDQAGVIVEPGDVDQVERNIANLGELRAIERWCPDCYNYVIVSGRDYLSRWSADYATNCQHEPKHTPEAQPANRHWFSYMFEPHALVNR
jgi:hypothetical protein